MDSYLSGIGYKFMLAFKQAGGNPEEVKLITTNPRLLQELIQLHRGNAEIKPRRRIFRTWCTIQIGTYKTRTKRSEVVEAHAFQLNDVASEILKKRPLIRKSSEIELVTVTPEDLGFPGMAYRNDIYERASSFGLFLCDAQFGLHVLLQCPERIDWRGQEIAMQPIAHTCPHFTERYIMHLINNQDGPRLCALHGTLGLVRSDNTFVFSRTRYRY